MYAKPRRRAGNRHARSNYRERSGGCLREDFIATPQHAGFISGRVELEEDTFDADNDRYFSIEVPEQVAVLLSSSDPKSSTYLRLALTSHNEDETSTALALTELSPQQLTYSALVHADVVLLSNVASLSPLQTDQLSEFVSQGGGIILIPGSEVNVDQYNSFLLPKLGLPSLMPFEKQKTLGTSLSFEKIDFGHPVFQGMFGKRPWAGKEKKTASNLRRFLSQPGLHLKKKSARSFHSPTELPSYGKKYPGSLQAEPTPPAFWVLLWRQTPNGQIFP